MTVTWGATGVRVVFGATVALDDVSLTATPGTVTAVVGGDGAGKTTLLRCLGGALAPSSGTVSRPGAIATGYFPASSGVYPDLTVAENLAFRATAYGLRGTEARARIAELTELAGLAAAIGRPAGKLSGGMRRKLGVIAAMLHRPALLILDEPSTGVDPVSRSGLWWLITRAAADGAAVVLATTYLDDAQRAGSVLVLDSGRVLAVGTPDQIVADMPGSVHSVAAQPEGTAAAYAWRRAGGWRLWCPPGASGSPGTPMEAKTVAADLQDAVTVAALRRELTLSDGKLAADPVPAPATPIGRDRPLAEAVAVTCKFGQLTAVRDVSVEVRAGEVVGLLGANGAGKTTLIRMLLGLQHASSGTVALLGEPPSRQTRRLIGYVPQGLGLYDDLTAAENMAFSAAIFGSEAPRLPEDIERQAGTVVGMLPLGLQRRLAFAEALAHRPELLILDEPTSGVDPLGRARLWDTIAAAAAAGAGVLVSTHYMEEASECDRLVVMAGGQVVAAGTAKEIIGDAQVTVVRTSEWAAAFSALAAAGIPAALAGQALRVPEAGQAAVAAVLASTVLAGTALAGTALAGPGQAVQLSSAPATLEERFFELATQTQAVPA